MEEWIPVTARKMTASNLVVVKGCALGTISGVAITARSLMGHRSAPATTVRRSTNRVDSARSSVPRFAPMLQNTSAELARSRNETVSSAEARSQEKPARPGSAPRRAATRGEITQQLPRGARRSTPLGSRALAAGARFPAISRRPLGTAREHAESRPVGTKVTASRRLNSPYSWPSTRCVRSAAPTTGERRVLRSITATSRVVFGARSASTATPDSATLATIRSDSRQQLPTSFADHVGLPPSSMEGGERP
jgi:hypothetical protein